jgi:hypothetical protein
MGGMERTCGGERAREEDIQQKNRKEYKKAVWKCSITWPGGAGGKDKKKNSV